MPIYEFTCKKCNVAFERFVLSSSNLHDVKCPRCGAADVKKMMSSFSRGSGFSTLGFPAGSSGPGPVPSGGCGSPGGFS